ncbi:hypothetical protein SAMN05446037_1003297 [Anaerovirgula multivorans]|uniref:Uncharacterized protein n=1 Tax=Anaerovirgula multivorans TaxID=312168 RepID=A0A239BJ50_9FIRM|nr:hypothetical protein [Anaerovirgula multivorans]SNS07632.1 hypothetical protein SAMN05446037_1003297 [Anaerovirgula multivorans]
MSETNKNDVLGNIFGGTGSDNVLSNFFGGFFRGKNTIIIIILLFLLIGQKGLFCKFDENLILVFVVVILLFGGSFKF